MDWTKLLAWWGAILSTIVFGWDVYKFRSAGPRLRFSIRTGMETIGVPHYEGKALICAEVTNIGDRSTTITNLGYEHFGKGLRFINRKNDKAAVILVPSLAQPLPFELKPGAVWTGLALQDEIEKWPTTGVLYMVLCHSHSKKPLRRRVIIHQNED